jgi:hypothetical protein
MNELVNTYIQILASSWRMGIQTLFIAKTHTVEYISDYFRLTAFADFPMPNK